MTEYLEIHFMQECPDCRHLTVYSSKGRASNQALSGDGSDRSRARETPVNYFDGSDF